MGQDERGGGWDRLRGEGMGQDERGGRWDRMRGEGDGTG